MNRWPIPIVNAYLAHKQASGDPRTLLMAVAVGTTVALFTPFAITADMGT